MLCQAESNGSSDCTSEGDSGEGGGCEEDAVAWSSVVARRDLVSCQIMSDYKIYYTKGRYT